MLNHVITVSQTSLLLYLKHALVFAIHSETARLWEGRIAQMKYIYTLSAYWIFIFIQTLWEGNLERRGKSRGRGDGFQYLGHQGLVERGHSLIINMLSSQKGRVELFCWSINLDRDHRHLQKQVWDKMHLEKNLVQEEIRPALNLLNNNSRV